LAAALDAGISGRVVYLDQGTHTFPVLDARALGIKVRGGFRRNGAPWQRDCAPDPETRTRIVSTNCSGLRLETANVSFENLSIEIQAQAKTVAGQAGESCYGMRIDGVGYVHLNKVIVKSAAGAPGGTATATIAAPAASCSGTAPTCSNAAQGPSGPPGAQASVSGKFDAAGFIPENGADAKPGGEGAHGPQGAIGVATTCHSSCKCITTGGGAGSTVCVMNTSTTVNGGAGKCGCGGRGGAAGGKGFGGGASVGIFLATSKTSLRLTDTRILLADGGNGSKGVDGATGSAGTVGASGTEAACGYCPGTGTGCVSSCSPTSSTAPGGTGSSGGMGGPGGRGGNGAGGSSVGVVSPNGTVVELLNSSIVLGKGGVGPDAAADGQAQEQITF
jgi:hypothetical protein